MNELEAHLRRFRLFYRLQNGSLALQRTFWIPAFISLLIQIIGHLQPILNLGLFTIAPWFIWIFTMIGFALLHSVSLMKTAIRVDQASDLKERLSSLLSFQQAGSSFNPYLLSRQRNDALSNAARVEPGRAFPLEWQRRPMTIGIGILCLVLVSVLLPNRMDQVIQERQAVQKAAQEQANKIEELGKKIQADETISSEEREELQSLLEELSASLRKNPGDLEQALADLSRLDQQLKSRLDPGLNTQQAFLDSLANRMAQLSSEQTRTDPVSTTEQALEQLMKQIDDLDQTQLEQLGRELAQLSAQASQAGNTGLSQSLAALSRAVQNGDTQGAREASEALRSALGQLNQDLINQQARQGALAQSQTSQQALSQIGRQIAAGQGQNPGSNQGLGTGQGNSPGGGGGAKTNQLPPFRGGKTNLPSPRGEAPAPQTGLLGDQVFAPWQRSNTSDTQLFISGQDTDQGETTSTEGEGSQPGLANPVLTPYQQVLPQYLNAANQAMQQATVPASLIDYVRQYFSSLGTP